MEEQLLWIANMIGAVACGISGAMMAVDRGMDVIGVLFLGSVTATGGGILRDVLLGQVPPQMFTHSEFLAAAAGVSLVVFLLACRLYGRIQRRRELLDQIMNLFDAVGLGAFGVAGIQTAVAAGYGSNHLLVLFMGGTTAIGGGVLRDVLCSRVPFVLHKRVYFLAALGGCIVYDLLYPHRPLLAMLLAIVLVTAIRLLAARFRWSMPRIKPFEK